MRFRVLGAVAAEAGGLPVDLGPARQRAVLAVLLVNANLPVPADVLLNRVWGDRLPQRARNTLSGYLSRLRQVLAADPEVTLSRYSSGYQLTVDPADVDLHLFRRLARTGRERGDYDRLADALALLRGEPFGGFDTPWFAAVRSELAAEHLAARLDFHDLALLRGRHAEALPSIAALHEEQPTDERAAGHLMLALYRCGRQADALLAYRRIRRTLAEEIGTDPGAPLQHLHRQILAGGPELDAPESARATGSAAAVPRQLPAPPRLFTGRATELAALDAGLADAGHTVPVTVLTGTAGVGKTALAVHWAHRVASRFPDGQLFLNLRGFDPLDRPVAAAEAVRSALDALGVPPAALPPTPDRQTGLYRSLLADRRVLVVLDNVRSADQVRPLLPGSPGCLVLVTSRDQLPGLVAADHAQLVPLELFGPAEARELLGARLGPARVAAEPQAVAELIVRCAGLPLALAVTAAHAATRPQLRLAVLSAELTAAAAEAPLTPFTGNDPAIDLRSVFACSYHLLTRSAARLFRLLSEYPGADVSGPAAASLAAGPVRAELAELTRAHLLEETKPDRFAMHDLLRAFAAELSAGTEPAEARARIIDHYLHSAHAAAMTLEPHRDPVTMPPVLDGVVPERPDAAAAWFIAERPTLIATVGHAAHAGLDAHVWGLAWSMTDAFNRQARWHDLAACFTHAVHAAERLGDPAQEGYARRILGRALTRLDRPGEALDHLSRAVAIFERLGDPVGQAHSHIMTSVVYEHLDRWEDALRHDRRALALFRAGGHRVGEARALNNIGWRLIRMDDCRQAIDHCEQAYEICRQIGDRYDEANVADSLGLAHHRMGRPDRAITFYGRAIDLYRQTGHRPGEGLSLLRIGDARLAVGEREAAHADWRRAAGILTDVDHPRAAEARARLAAN
jgi:DNA-binding SARP family transcriptional activator